MYKVYIHVYMSPQTGLLQEGYTVNTIDVSCDGDTAVLYCKVNTYIPPDIHMRKLNIILLVESEKVC